MQASYASSHIGYAEEHGNHPIRFRMPHAYLLEGNGGAKRRSCRPDRGAYAKEKGCHSDVRCTPSARHAHFAAHHFRLKCAGDFSCFPSFMSLFQCFFASLHAMHTMAKNGVQDSVHGVQGSVHERRNAQIGMACQAHAAPLLYVRPHPTAARRAATLASSECEMHMGARISLRPLQRRFKARKKPEGYMSTPTGLKRLKTQNTAFRINGNGKGTPSGVPQPIHKRKLVLVEEEFDASSSGGAAGN